MMAMTKHGNAPAMEAPRTDYSKVVLDNGAYDLDREKFTAHPPGDRPDDWYPINYEPEARCPVFDRAMDDWFPSGDYREAVLEMFALCFLRKNVLRDNIRRRMYVNYGKGSNGKSTCLNVLRQMLGSWNITSEFAGRHISSSIRDKSACIMSDGADMTPNRMKQAISILEGSPVACNSRLGGPVSFRPYCTMIFECNELPPIMDVDGGYAYKIRYVPWGGRFKPGTDAEIESLPYDESERSGIFNELVPVMRRLLMTDYR